MVKSVFLSTASIAVVAAMTLVSAPDAQAMNVQSAYPGSLTQVGTMGVRVVDVIDRLTDGELDLEFQEPGALVPALETFDAVAAGAIEMGWSTPAFWAGKVPALQIFSSLPFGPQAGEFGAWYYFGGGKEMFEEIYAGQGIHGVICGVLAPEASGWFREEITSVEDLQGLKMRFFGLGARVMEKMGVSTQLLAAGDIFPALELGTIDATEFSMPAIDLNLGFYQVAQHYYFPGWHQQSTFMELIINKGVWDGLTDTQRLAIETACGDNFRHGLTEGEYLQFSALQELQERGVTIHTWSPEILATLKAAWEEVVAEQAAANPDFARVWESLSTFRENYAVWGNLGYLPRD